MHVQEALQQKKFLLNSQELFGPHAFVHFNKPLEPNGVVRVAHLCRHPVLSSCRGYLRGAHAVTTAHLIKGDLRLNSFGSVQCEQRSYCFRTQVQVEIGLGAAPSREPSYADQNFPQPVTLFAC